MRKIHLLFLPFTLLVGVIFSCSKATVPPDFKFNTGPGYTYTNATNNNTNITVGIIAAKGGTRLKSVDILYTDINGVSHTDTTITITDRSQQDKFTYDCIITPPTPYATGVATWTFIVTDQHGNNATRAITITYQ